MATDLQLTQAIRRSAAINPNGLATIDGDRTRTHAEFCARVARAAGGLRALGLQPGDRVSTLALNSDAFLEHYMACWWLGVIPAPLNIRWSDEELLHAIDLVRPSIMLVDSAFRDRVTGFVDAAESVKQVVSLDSVHDNGTTWEELAVDGEDLPDQGFSGSDSALLLFTGGTTARPKAVELSHRNLVIAGIGMRAMGCGTSERLLHVPPLFHLGGVQMSLAHWLGGGTHVMIPGFHAENVAKNIEKHRVTDLLMAPTMIEMLLRAPGLSTYDLSSLEQITYGTSPMTPDLMNRVMEAFPNAQFAQGYGMTETGMTVMLAPAHHLPENRARGKLRSIGVPSPLVELRVVDPFNRVVPTGDAGELVVRGAGVMKGYWNAPERTAAAIDADGWLHTGDGARVDDEGFVYLTDRIKDMIITGGENVFSVEVENVLSTFPGVGLVAVIAVADAVWGEAVHAVVVPTEGSDLTADELIAHARAQLSPYKVPRGVTFVDQLPLSATGKILKNRLRDEFSVDHAV